MAMDSSSARSHPQEIGSQTLESMLIPTKSQAEKKTKPADQHALKCPRCDSTNTKFCYYNNYSLSQPRYFCKSCRRYWTKGGTLRNVPVGGGCRKTKRSSSYKKTHDQPILTRIPSPINPNSYNSPLSYDSNVFTSGSQLPFDAGFSMPRNPNMPVGGFLETPLGFQSLYYGVGDGGVDLGLEMNGGMGMGMGMGISGLNHEMGLMGFEDLSGPTTNVKQENCSDFGKGDHNHGEISRGLWGFAWQNGDGNIGSWNGIGSSNWHGLLNTPLM